jgi:hypothetical protein
VKAENWIICASGPSMKPLDPVPGWSCMVVNNTWKLAPWADVLYAGDPNWWEAYGHEVKHWRGVKYTRHLRSAARYGCEYVRRIRKGEGLCTQPMVIHSGGNSGYQAVNLAYHLGARRIILLGFDMHRRNGGHWFGEHQNMLSAPINHIKEWVRLFRPLARDLANMGVEVINATPGSDLDCFPKMSLAQALGVCNASAA